MGGVRTVWVAFFLASVCLSQCAAGGVVDDFNDSTPDPNVWERDYAFGISGIQFSEQNERLELLNKATSPDQSYVAHPSLLSLSYTSDWKVSVDVVNAKDANDASVRIGLVVSRAAIDANAFDPNAGPRGLLAGILLKADNGGMRLQNTNFSDLWPYYASANPQNNGVLEISYGAAQHVLSLGFASGRGNPVSVFQTVDVTGGSNGRLPDSACDPCDWGMTGDDHFILSLFATTAGTAVSSGEAYLDNLRMEEGSRLAPVYRFWSVKNKYYFYTIKEAEKNKLIANYSSSWTYDSVAYYALPDSNDPNGNDPNSRPVYRFWSPKSGTHFYTISAGEKDKLIKNFADAWTFEGVAFRAYPEGLQPADARPVHRFWSPTTGTHFYTISPAVSSYISDANLPEWTNEGTAWYAYEVTANFPDYARMSEDEGRVFTWTYGGDGNSVTQIASPAMVDYADGTRLTGTRVSNAWVMEGQLHSDAGYNDGVTAKTLMIADYSLSSDPNVVSYPEAYSFGTIADGQCVDLGTYYLLNSNMTPPVRKGENQVLMYDIRDVNVVSGRCPDAMITWNIDTTRPFAPLNFHGKEADLGIMLPTDLDTAGHAITRFRIRGLYSSIIAMGSVDPNTGELTSLAELQKVEKVELPQ
jgi:hypothetical protein